MNLSMDQRMEFTAAFAGYGFLSVARHFRELEDDDPNVFGLVVKLLDVDPGDAAFMARINRRFEELGVNDSHMTVLGWPKLILLVDHISLDNRQHLLELADLVTAKELATILKGRSARKRMVLRLTADQYRALEEAILAHGGVRSARDPDQLSGKEEALVKALAPQKA